MYKNLPCSSDIVEESLFVHLLATIKNWRQLFFQSPDQMYCREIEGTKRVEILLMVNTVPYRIYMGIAIFHEMEKAIRSGATLEEIVYMLKLPK